MSVGSQTFFDAIARHPRASASAFAVVVAIAAVNVEAYGPANDPDICPADYAVKYNERSIGMDEDTRQIYVDFCMANKEMNALNPGRWIYDARFIWRTMKDGLGL